LVARSPAATNLKEFSGVLTLANLERMPIVIEATGVREEWLQTEQVGNPRKRLDYIESCLADVDEDILDSFLQQTNFELLHPVPASRLRFCKIVGPRSGNDSFENLTLESLTQVETAPPIQISN